VQPGSQMEAVLQTRSLMVNSLHHKAVHTPGKGAVISGRSPHGIAELLEVPANRFVLAAQFHPEEIYMKDVPSARLFKAFVRACGDIPGDESEEAALTEVEERSLAR
jgi:putative glutamine amidotransferase